MILTVNNDWNHRLSKRLVFVMNAFMFPLG
jgi:hypothetical protein